MSSSTALLPKPIKKENEHPIFLRVCHAPYTHIGQKALSALRFMTAAYLFVTGWMIVKYEREYTDHNYLAYFEFTNVSFLMQFIYQAIAFTWTFMHLHYPHHGSQSQSSSTIFQKLFSPPRQNNGNCNRTWFSIFYTAAISFPWVSAAIHWVIMYPQHKTTIPDNDIFGHGDFTAYIAIARYIISPLLTLIEVFFFSSITRSTPIDVHHAGLSTLASCYIGWVYVGYHYTDRYGYFFFDPEQVGWNYVFIYWGAFAAAVNVAFWWIYIVTWFRESISRKNEKKSGYSVLPQ